ncbi:hypothetical protein FOA52_014265 [Chlamydomonas sp. UWO 241]|nr:hypothetical protein FOA52_014265 [Chlamydomonas sp. UWO 241]
MGDFHRCTPDAPVHRVKVHQRNIYVDTGFFDNPSARYGDGYGLAILDVLMVAVHIYKDFPDVEFALDLADNPHRCDLDLPFLKFSVVNVSRIMGSSDDVQYDFEALVQTYYGQQGTPTNYTRGFTMPLAHAWRLGYEKPVLQQLVECINEEHPWEARTPTVLWRGKATGANPWSKHVQYPTRVGSVSTPAKDVVKKSGPFINKRAYMAALSLPHVWLDVGLTGEFEAMRTLEREPVPFERWGEAASTISIDGFGPAYRLNMQLLMGTALLKMDSPFETWIEPRLTDGVHYRSFRYDLTNYLEASRSLVTGDLGRDSAAHKMAAKSQALAVEALDVFAQLDSFVWSICRIKEVSHWEVVPPSEGDGWMQLSVPDALCARTKGRDCDLIRYPNDWSRGVPTVVRDAMRTEHTLWFTSTNKTYEEQAKPNIWKWPKPKAERVGRAGLGGKKRGVATSPWVRVRQRANNEAVPDGR